MRVHVVPLRRERVDPLGWGAASAVLHRETQTRYLPHARKKSTCTTAHTHRERAVHRTRTFVARTLRTATHAASLAHKPRRHVESVPRDAERRNAQRSTARVRDTLHRAHTSTQCCAQSCLFLSRVILFCAFVCTAIRRVAWTSPGFQWRMWRTSWHGYWCSGYSGIGHGYFLLPPKPVLFHSLPLALSPPLLFPPLPSPSSPPSPVSRRRRPTRLWLACLAKSLRNGYDRGKGKSRKR